MPTITKIYTMEEASEHNTKDDCWVVIDGKVYDVSSYLDEHPGGDDVLLRATGKDATDEFEDAGHSKTARELMEQYCIGNLIKRHLLFQSWRLYPRSKISRAFHRKS
ncbi:UNVERIFIED_CONTAM: cytochrome isoform A [Sesamum radiatum]|uniref:Cytochrome isoform A n=1 Tax=Sesamum radiatum TaxID=300843 RepID=A0AAW2TWW7_SESRA